MIETKHTPGPWEIEPKERRDHPLYVMSSEGDRIAKCDGLNMADFGPNAEQAKANARLIASAPQLNEIVGAIEELRHEEGAAVTIACGNPEGIGPDNEAVEVVSDWTNWQPIRFMGSSLRVALANALREKLLAREAGR